MMTGMTGQRSTDPLTVIVAETITGFNWGNYGLDDVGQIDPDDADYAWALAEQILTALGPAL